MIIKCERLPWRASHKFHAVDHTASIFLIEMHWIGGDVTVQYLRDSHHVVVCTCNIEEEEEIDLGLAIYLQYYIY